MLPSDSQRKTWNWRDFPSKISISIKYLLYSLDKALDHSVLAKKIKAHSVQLDDTEASYGALIILIVTTKRHRIKIFLSHFDILSHQFLLK